MSRIERRAGPSVPVPLFVARLNVLHVTRIDRLAKSMHDFARIAHDLKSKPGYRLEGDPAGDRHEQRGPVGALTMNLLAAFAQFETEIRRERQMEGIAKAKGAGKYKGRKPLPITTEEVSTGNRAGPPPSRASSEYRARACTGC